MHDPQQVEVEEGINSLSFPFEDDDITTNVSDSKYESHDRHEHDIESQEDQDLDPTTIPNQRPKWAQNLIEAFEDIVGDPDDRRRTRS